MTTALDIDIAALVGEMEAPACEHSQHSGRPQWHADGGERYVKLSPPCGHADLNAVRVFCLRWLTESDLVICPRCAEEFPLKGHYTDLGPVGTTK